MMMMMMMIMISMTISMTMMMDGWKCKGIKMKMQGYTIVTK